VSSSAIDPQAATTAIVVHFGSWEPTRRAVTALAASQPPVAILVVDNGGGREEGSLDAAARVLKDPAGGNLGYGGGCNLGARSARSPYLLFCNNDVEVYPDTIAVLEDALRRDPHVAAVGPLLVDGQGRRTPSVGRAPTPRRILFESLFLPRIFAGIPAFDGHHTVAFRHDEARDVETLLGAVVLVRRDAFEAVGLFDERFPFYAEESDLFERLRKAGWRLRFEPRAGAVHHGGLSSRSVPQRELDRRLHEGLALFARLHHGEDGERRARRSLRRGARLRWLLSFLEPTSRRMARRQRYSDLLDLYKRPREEGGLSSSPHG
jgi:N-acetylglucosaminyl-diphospho-decaprenol L-rhamnosyltransferase